MLLYTTVGTAPRLAQLQQSQTDTGGNRVDHGDLGDGPPQHGGAP